MPEFSRSVKRVTSTAVPCGISLSRQQQHLLPDDLGADLLLRLVGGHAVGEELRALHGVLRCSCVSSSSSPSPVRAEMGMMASKSG